MLVQCTIVHLTVSDSFIFLNGDCISSISSKSTTKLTLLHLRIIEQHPSVSFVSFNLYLGWMPASMCCDVSFENVAV